MRNIKVTADYNGTILLKRAQIITEIVLPFHTVRKTGKSVLRVRRVNVDKVKILELQCYDTALVIVLVNADAVLHGDGHSFCKTAVPE